MGVLDHGNGPASLRAARSRRARRALGAVCVRRAGLPRRGENRFLRPMQKESLVFKQRPLRRFPAPCARALSAATTGTFIERGRGGRGSGRGGPLPRARVFSLCPAYPRRQGGAGYPCPRLAAGRIPAPRSALSPGPLAGRFRAVRGARRGLGRLAPAWLVRGGVRCLLLLLPRRFGRRFGLGGGLGRLWFVCGARAPVWFACRSCSAARRGRLGSRRLRCGVPGRAAGGSARARWRGGVAWSWWLSPGECGRAGRSSGRPVWRRTFARGRPNRSGSPNPCPPWRLRRSQRRSGGTVRRAGRGRQSAPATPRAPRARAVAGGGG